MLPASCQLPQVQKHQDSFPGLCLLPANCHLYRKHPSSFPGLLIYLLLLQEDFVSLGQCCLHPANCHMYRSTRTAFQYCHAIPFLRQWCLFLPANSHMLGSIMTAISMTVTSFFSHVGGAFASCSVTCTGSNKVAFPGLSQHPLPMLLEPLLSKCYIYRRQQGSLPCLS